MNKANTKVVPNIIIIGAGNLGRRYLQGLTDLQLECTIWVIDKNEKALELAKLLNLDFIKSKYHKNILFSQNIPTEINFFDLAIVATTAENRSVIIDNVLQNCQIKYWILEKPFLAFA